MEMNPTLFALAVTAGCAFLLLASFIAYAAYKDGDGVLYSLPVSGPIAVIGVVVLTAAGLGAAGVIA